MNYNSGDKSDDNDWPSSVVMSGQTGRANERISEGK
jgi:hypothetical protein